eukprot:627253-Amphidinium_carterae.1
MEEETMTLFWDQNYSYGRELRRRSSDVSAVWLVSMTNLTHIMLLVEHSSGCSFRSGLHDDVSRKSVLSKCSMRFFRASTSIDNYVRSIETRLHAIAVRSSTQSNSNRDHLIACALYLQGDRLCVWHRGFHSTS